VNGHRLVYCKQCRVHNGEVGCIGSGLCKRCHEKFGCGAGCKEKKVKVRKAPGPGRRDQWWWSGGDEDPVGYDDNSWERNQLSH
jgi:hypothetical protein